MSSNTATNRTAEEAFVIGGGAINEKKRSLKQTTQQGVQEEDDKTSGYDPVGSRSHLMHALEGMDRYPNYLSRWSEADMDLLEEALESQLRKVREQKEAVLKRRQGIDAMVERLVEQNDKWSELLTPPKTWKEIQDSVLDPRAAKAIFKSKLFTSSSNKPTVEQVLSGQVSVELDAYLLEELMEEELFDVYSLPLLSSEVSFLSGDSIFS